MSFFWFNFVSTGINLRIVCLALSHWIIGRLALLNYSNSADHVVDALNTECHAHHIWMFAVNLSALPNFMLILYVVNINLGLSKLLSFCICFGVNIWCHCILLFIVFVINIWCFKSEIVSIAANGVFGELGIHCLTCLLFIWRIWRVDSRHWWLTDHWFVIHPIEWN